MTSYISSHPYQFCNNCGKTGHSYNQCSKPITSNGIIAFTKTANKITTNTDKIVFFTFSPYSEHKYSN